MKNFCNKNIKNILLLASLWIPLVIFLAISGMSAAIPAAAAPKDTLPPGFYSTPLSQPKTEEEASPEAEEDNSSPPAEKTADFSFLPFFEKTLLLPPATGFLFGKNGLGDEIWLDSETETIIDLMNEWRVKLHSRPVADLARRLLLTHAITPPNIDPFAFMKLRLEKLYQLGDIKMLERFFYNFPILASDKNFSLLYQKKIFTQGAARGESVSEGCALWKTGQRLRPREGFPVPPQPIEQQISALCRGFSGAPGRGLSEAESLSDQSRASRNFFPLLAAALNASAQSGRKTQIRDSAPREINAVLWSLYKIVKRQPRYIYIDNVDPALLPFMARDRDLSYNWRLAAVQRAILRGLLPPRSLQGFYVKNPHRRIANSDSIQIPPRRSSDQERSGNVDSAQVRKISNVLANAPNRTAYIAFLHSWARDIAFLNPKSGYRRADGLRASLLLMKPPRMKIWLGASGASGASNLPVPMRSILAVLEDSKRASHRGIAPEAIDRWQTKTDLIVKVIGKEFFGVNAPGIPGEDDTEEGDALMDAVDNEARAEIILRVLVGMDNAALARSPSFLRAVIKGLIAAGLKNEAWRIAVDIFLIEAWGP